MEMYDLYLDNAIDIALRYYKTHNYDKQVHYKIENALNMMSEDPDFLLTTNIVSEAWLQQKSSTINHATFKSLRNIVYLLRSIINNGKVITTRFVYLNSPNYQKLNPVFKKSLNNFLAFHQKTHPESKYQDYFRVCSAKRIIALQKQGVRSPKEINYDNLAIFTSPDNLNGHSNRLINNHYNAVFSHYIKYIESVYKCPNTLHLMLDVIAPKFLIRIQALPDTQKTQIYSISKNSHKLSAFTTVLNNFENLILHTNYGKTRRKAVKKFLTYYQFFIEANNLSSSITMFMYWSKLIHPLLSKGNANELNRISFLLLRYNKKNVLDLTSIHSVKKSKYQPPNWSYSVFLDYENERVLEGMKTSTCFMDRSSICRFLCFLDAKNVTSWESITPSIIIDYLTYDIHRTPEGKNVYTIKLRNFIRYLGRKGLVNKILSLAATTNNIKSTRIISILDKQQKDAIYSFVDNCKTAIEYRNAAIIVLALHLGVRKIDISNLQFSNVNFKKAEIAFVQQKTGQPVLFPIPNIVGNTLYRYITKGRPKQALSCPYIFVRHKMPFSKLQNITLNDLFARLAIKYHCNPITGIHIFRRDYGTSLLEKGTGFQMVASALGQISEDSVKPYLALHDTNMKKCPLTLAGIEYRGKVYER